MRITFVGSSVFGSSRTRLFGSGTGAAAPARGNTNPAVAARAASDATAAAIATLRRTRRRGAPEAGGIAVESPSTASTIELLGELRMISRYTASISADG